MSQLNEILELIQPWRNFLLPVITLVFLVLGISKIIDFVLDLLEPRLKTIHQRKYKRDWISRGEPSLYVDPESGTITPIGVQYNGGNAYLEFKELSLLISGDGDGKTRQSWWVKGAVPIQGHDISERSY